ncbi:hypothetical protein D3C73_1551840 [compost metagenome]
MAVGRIVLMTSMAAWAVPIFPFKPDPLPAVFVAALSVALSSSDLRSTVVSDPDLVCAFLYLS